MTTPTESEIAWAAGLFEGEGCFTIQRSPRTRADGSTVTYMSPVARIHMTDRDVVEKFSRIVGFGHFNDVPRRRGGLGSKPCFEWWTTKEPEFRRLLAMFEPWLGARRLARAKEVLSTIETNREEYGIVRSA